MFVQLEKISLQSILSKTQAIMALLYSENLVLVRDLS